MLIGVEEDLEKLFPLEVLFFSKFGFWLSTCLGSFLVDAVSQSHELRPGHMWALPSLWVLTRLGDL